MSLVMTGRAKFAKLLDEFKSKEEKHCVYALDHSALRLIRFTGEFFNGVRSPTHFEEDLEALQTYNEQREALIEKMKADGKSEDEINETVKGAATVPEPEPGQGMWFTIQGHTKYLMTHEDSVWLAWKHSKVLYLTPIERDEVKEFAQSVQVNAVVVNTKTFSLIGE